MAVNKAKLEEHANKVYRGDLRRFKEKQRKDNSFTFDLFLTETTKATKGKRVAPSSSQGKVVIDNCKRECIICGKKYNDPDDFQIHHVNGDQSKTTTNNLVLLCLSCHKKVHTIASAKLKDYKERNKGSSTKNAQISLGFPTFDLPKFDIPSFDSPFDSAPKKKSRKKKGDNDW